MLQRQLRPFECIPTAKMPTLHTLIEKKGMRGATMETIRGHLLGTTHRGYPHMKCVAVLRKGELETKKGMAHVIEIVYWGLTGGNDGTGTTEGSG